MPTTLALHRGVDGPLSWNTCYTKPSRACGVVSTAGGFYGDLHPVSAQTLTNVLASLGVDASTDQACEQAPGRSDRSAMA